MSAREQRPPITLRRDPLLDPSLAERIAAAFVKYSPAIVAVITLAAIAGELDRRDAAVLAEERGAALARKAQELEKARRKLALRESAGTCSTLFYLVEASDPEAAGEKLAKASMQIAEAANHALYPVPPYQLRTQ